jgi:hypothetical protein
MCEGVLRQGVTLAQRAQSPSECRACSGWVLIERGSHSGSVAVPRVSVQSVLVGSALVL